MRLDQAELAQLARVSRGTIVHLERDSGWSPNGNVMAAVARALGCDLGEVFWSEATAEDVA